MIIYRVRAWINNRNREGTFESNPFQQDEVIIDNLETAKEVFNEFKKVVVTNERVKGATGYCDLFIPHRFSDGKLAEWPDNMEYIDRYKF